MSNPPKKKGTSGENEVVAIFQKVGLPARRTSPGVNYDVYVPGRMIGIDPTPFQILATRPDRGQWLATLPLEDLVDLLRHYNEDEPEPWPVEVEVKRYRRFAIHAIYDSKFNGRGK